MHPLRKLREADKGFILTGGALPLRWTQIEILLGRFRDHL